MAPPQRSGLAHFSPCTLEESLDENGFFQRPSIELLSFLGLEKKGTQESPFGTLFASFDGSQMPSILEVDTWSGLVCTREANGHPPGTAHISLTRAPDDRSICARVRILSMAGNALAPPATAPSTFREEQHETQQVFEAIVRDMPSFCYTVGRDLVFTSSQGGGLKGLGLKPGEAIGLSLFEMWGTHDPNYEPFVRHVRALQGEPQTYQDVCFGRSLQYHLTPLRNADQQVVGVIGLGLDVTEQQDAQREHARLSAQLQQAQRMESIGRLAGGVAHDFNNFLTCVMGNLSLIETKVPPDPEIAGYLAAVSSAIGNAADLTRQLLTFSRKQVLDSRPLNIATLSNRVANLLRRLVGDDIELRTNHPADLWIVQADVGQLEQVLVNLVVNAKDAISTSGTIVVETANTTMEGANSLDLTPGQYVMLSVADNGQGMSDIVKDQLFEPFFTTKQSGQGTGLGLSMVYGTVEQHGGKIAVESKLGSGTVFRIYLPRVLEEEDPKSSQRTSPANPSRGGTETILLVEDEPAVLELASMTLQQLGYNVLPCANPDDALLTFDDYRNTIDLLVTDMVMPRINGPELASRLCSLQPGLPVLYCSGYSEESAMLENQPSSNVQFMGKPYRQAQLAHAVRQLLDKELANN